MLVFFIERCRGACKYQILVFETIILLLFMFKSLWINSCNIWKQIEAFDICVLRRMRGVNMWEILIAYKENENIEIFHI